MVVSRCLVVAFLCFGLCSARLLRVPKVYNAVINSSDNLAPSRAFPLIQPVVHETYPAYPYSSVIYHQPHIPLPPASLNPYPPGALPPGAFPPGAFPQGPIPTRNNGEPPKAESETPKEGPEQNPSEIPPQEPSPSPPQQLPKPNQEKPSDNPLNLNEFGLPPSLIPVQQYTPRVTYQYDPFPYYSDPYNGVLLPYNPYFPQYPYPFYVPQPQGGQQPQQPAQWPQGGPQEQQPPQQQPPQQQPQPPQQQPEMNIKNNVQKSPDIPDVPPPPPPTGQRKAN